MDYDDLTVTSLVSEIFDPSDNPLVRFIDTVDHAMNSNTLLLKGRTNQHLIMDSHTSILSLLISASLTDLLLDFDRRSKLFNNHSWHDVPEVEADFYAGYKPRLGALVKSDTVLKKKPVSYLGFAERLHWMLRTSPTYYSDHHPDEETTHMLIRDVSLILFGAEAWKIGDLPQPWNGLPTWIDHPWTFFDVVPDFLNTTGYWDTKSNDESEEELDKRLAQLAYFDGGPSDSCLFFYRDDVFYFLLTNGSP
jgi:hypothetical protein